MSLEVKALLAFLMVICLASLASAGTYEMGEYDGNSGFQGMIAMDENGNLAITLVAVVNGGFTTNMDATDTDGVHAEQCTTVEGGAAFTGSGASNTYGDNAATADLALGENSLEAGATIETDQGAGADCSGASAGQVDTLVAGEAGAAGSFASLNMGDAVVVLDTVSCGEGCGDCGSCDESCSGPDCGDERGDTAYSVSTFEDGSMFLGVQGASASIGNTASAGQSVLMGATEGEMYTGAESFGGDSASTYTGFEVDECSLAPAQAFASQGAYAGYSAGAEQISEVAIFDGGSAVAETTASAWDGNEAGTSASFSTQNVGLLMVDQDAAAYGDAYASQEALVASDDEAQASSWAETCSGDEAETKAKVYDGGVIQTDQGAAAGDVYVCGIEAEGVAAGQVTSLQAVEGGYVKSTATDEGCDENEAGTKASIQGQGTIETAQGAAAGDVSGNLFGHPVEADGAVAAQASTLQSNEGGEASSWASNEDPNYARTEAGYYGDGGIDCTIQGAAAGEVEVFGDDWVEGAVAIQDTERIYLDVEDQAPPVVGVAVDGEPKIWASSYSNNDGENKAGTKAYALGPGAQILDTTQGAIAGEGSLYHLGLDVEGAAAGQYTEAILSCFGGGAKTWADSDPPCFEDDSCGGLGGYGDSGCGVVGVSSGSSGCCGDSCSGCDGCGDCGSDFCDPEASASTEVGFRGVGGIEGTLQIAGAGEIESGMGEASGAVAIQHTDLIWVEPAEQAPDLGIETDGDDNQNKAWASSSSNFDDQSKAGTKTFALGPGSISETTQGAIAGEGELYYIGVEVQGAAAGQYTELIESYAGGGAKTWTTLDPVCPEDDEASASTKAMFFGEEGSIENTLQIAGSGEVESSLFETAGSAAFQHTDEIEVEDGVAFTETEAEHHSDIDSAETGNMVCGDGLIEGTTQAAFAGETEAWIFDLEGAGAFQQTMLIASDDHGSAWSKANNEWENQAGTKAEFDGSGTIADTTQGAIAGEVEAGLFEIEGAAAGQITPLILSTDGGSAKSWANNDCENFAQSNSSYTGIGTIVGLEQGAAGGEVEFGPFDIDGAIAGQEITTVGTVYGSVSAGTSSDAEDGMHTETFASASGLLPSISGSQVAAAYGGAFARQDIEISGSPAYAHTLGWSDCEGTNAGVNATSNRGNLDIEQLAFADGLVLAHQEGIAHSSGSNKVASVNAWSTDGTHFTKAFANVTPMTGKESTLIFEQTTLTDPGWSFTSQEVNISGKNGYTTDYASNSIFGGYAGMDSWMRTQTGGSGTQWMNVSGHSYSGPGLGILFPEGVERASAVETKDYVRIGTVNGAYSSISSYGVSNGPATFVYNEPPFDVHSNWQGNDNPPVPWIPGQFDSADHVTSRSDSINGYLPAWVVLEPYS